MLTKEQLAAEARKFDVKELADRAKVSPKTIYRLWEVPRNKKPVSPSFATLGRLIAAMSEMRALGLQKPAKPTAEQVQE